MVGLWMVMKARGHLRLKKVISRLMAMYTIPYVHPLASLTSVSHREAASPGESVARKT